MIEMTLPLLVSIPTSRSCSVFIFFSPWFCFGRELPSRELGGGLTAQPFPLLVVNAVVKFEIFFCVLVVTFEVVFSVECHC